MTSYEHKTLNVGKKTSHIALSCDDLTLAVVFNESDALWVGFVDVRYFGNQVSLLAQVYFFIFGITTFILFRHNGMITAVINFHILV